MNDSQSIVYYFAGVTPEIVFQLHFVTAMMHGEQFQTSAVLCKASNLCAMRDKFVSMLEEFPGWFYKNKTDFKRSIRYDIGHCHDMGMNFISNVDSLRGQTLHRVYVFDGITGWEESFLPVISSGKRTPNKGIYVCDN